MSLAREAHVAAAFDRTHDRFKPVVAASDARLHALRRALGPLEGRLILDLGCGKGRFARSLQDPGAHVLGVDLSAEMLAAARGLPRARATARRLPFANSSFDRVFAVEVLQHIHDVNAVLDEARRILKPGGMLVLIDRNAAALDRKRPWLPSLIVKAIDERRGLWMYPADGPVRERWFLARRLANRLAKRFTHVTFEYLVPDRPAAPWIHRHVPRSRPFVLWTARVPGGES